MTLHETALPAYEALAQHYDRFTVGHDHERWLAALERRLLRRRPPGRRLLDVGCGTGKSFAPMLARGWRVTACDLSPAMVEQARRRHPAAAAAVHVADMRALPAALGPVDVVTCLDDAVNYLVDDGDLHAAFAGVARVLAPGGLYAFDVNTRATYAQAFGADAVFEVDGVLFCWRQTGAAPGLHGATVEAFTRNGALWERTTSHHVQRHHPRAAIEAALRSAGLRLVEVVGQRMGGVLTADAPDEDRHTKLVYFARRPRPRGNPTRGGRKVMPAIITP